MIPARTPASARLAVATALVTVAVLASLAGLRSLVLAPWLATAVTGVLLVAVVVVVVRGLIGGRRARVAAAARAGVAVRRVLADDGGSETLWPTLAGAVAGLWFLAARFGGEDGTTQWLVTPESLGRLWEQLGLAGEIIRSEIAPVAPLPPIVMVCTAGAIVVLLAADALAAAARRPLLAAAAVLVLWLPVLTVIGELPWGTFAVTVAALLLSLTLDGPVTARRALRDPAVGAAIKRAEHRRSLITTSSAAAVTVVALGATAAAGGLPAVSTAWTDLFTTRVDAGTLSDNLDMNRSLQERSGNVMFTYTTTSGADVGPLRTMTLSDFDGRRWQGGDDDGVTIAPGHLLFPDDVPLGDQTDEVTLTVSRFADVRLPLPLEPRALTGDLDHRWRYDAGRDAVVGGPRTQEGETFSFTVQPRPLDAEVLRAAPRGADAVNARYLEVPSTEHEDDLRTLARELVGDAATDFDKALALQTYLRDPRNFTYSYDIPRPVTGDSVWDFMQSRQGFCVQFATAMVTLARTLGIPTRMAVGYLPGTRSPGTDTWRVTDEHAHAWPEVFFPGTGWVRFEPTPAIQTGPVPEHANPAAAPAQPAPAPTLPEQQQDQNVPPAQEATAPPVATPTAPQTEEEVAAEAEWSVRRWMIVAGSMLLVAAALVVLWLRRRRAHPPADAEEAWDRVVRALVAGGISLPTATTPRQVPEEAARAWTVHTGERVPDEVREGLVTLSEELEGERYAPSWEQLSPADLDRLAREITEAIEAGLSTPR